MARFDFDIAAGDAAEAGPAAGVDLAAAARRELAGLGLAVEGLAVSASGARLTLSGTAPTQALKEKIILAVGNMPGVAQVDDRLSGPAAAAAPRFHTVAPGETLWSIAEERLSSGAKHRDLFEANRPMLLDPDLIRPGMALRLPPD